MFNSVPYLLLAERKLKIRKVLLKLNQPQIIQIDSGISLFSRTQELFIEGENF
jgi:hypothetical protein